MYTELELVNHILQTLGETNTATLATNHPAVIQARTTLAAYNKEFQGMGWWFNKEKNIKLLPDAEGRVRVPEETLNFKVRECSVWNGQGTRFVKRGNFVYDTEAHSNILNVAVWADITLLLPYEDLPAAAGTYLKHFAAESAFLGDDGDLNQHGLLVKLTQDAWGELRKDELRSVGANALASPMSAWLLSRPRSRSNATNLAIIGG